MTNQPEAVLVERARNGDESAFEALYAMHRARAYAVSLKITRSHEDAEDIVQEVFLTLYAKIGTFRGESSFTTWFHRIVVNEALMHLRHQKLEEGFESIDEPNEDDEGRETVRDIPIVDAHLAFSVERIALRQAYGRLSQTIRIVFYLHDIEGYEHHEICELLGIEFSASKARLWRARQELISLLNPLTTVSGLERLLRSSNGNGRW